MNTTKTLRNLLDACVARCKVADEFRAGIYEVARTAVEEPDAAREALIAICQMCDPKYVAPIAAKKAAVVAAALGALGNNHGPGSPTAPSAEGEERSQSAPTTVSPVRNV